MPAIQSPYFDINYGWVYGEDGWNTGMDENLLRLSFLAKNAVNEFVSTLPSSVSDGYSCILNGDNLAYFWNNGSWVFVSLEQGYEFTTLVDGKRWVRTSTGYQEIPNNVDLDGRVTTLEGDLGEVELAVAENTQDIANLQQATGDITDNASSLPVTSDSVTMTLAEWMEYVRDRANHLGDQPASTISDFDDSVVGLINSTLTSDTLDISFDTGTGKISVEDSNSSGNLVFVDSGVLQVNEGSAVVELNQDVTSVVLPEPEFLRVRYTLLQIIQGADQSYTVTGWPQDIEWLDGGEPVISPDPSSVTMVQLVNIDDRGWVGSSSRSFDPAGSAAQALSDAKDYTDQAVQSPIPVAVEEEANIPNNCFFVDNVDDVLKFKDAQGIVHVVSLAP